MGGRINETCFENFLDLKELIQKQLKWMCAVMHSTNFISDRRVTRRIPVYGSRRRFPDVTAYIFMAQEIKSYHLLTQ